jgi:hypothetical protein
MKDPGPDSELCLLLIDSVIATVVDPDPYVFRAS